MSKVFNRTCEDWKALDQQFGTTTDSPLHHDNRCSCSTVVRKNELLNADELVIKAMELLKTEESKHVWQALRDVRREITVALSNVNYDETHPRKH